MFGPKAAKGVFMNQEHPAPLTGLAKTGLRLGVPAMAVSFTVLFSSLAITALEALIKTFFPHLTSEPWLSWALSSVSMYLLAMPLSLLFYRLLPPLAPKKNKMGAPLFLGLISLCFVLTYVGNWLGLLVNSIVSAVTGEPVVNALETLTLSSPLWANLLFAGILAPVMEELFYRKLIIDRLLPLGELPTVLLSGILFGLIHGNFSQFFYAAMIGILFGYVYLRTGNILYTVALHMCVNLVGGVYSSEMLKRLDPDALATNPSAEAILENAPGLIMMALYLLFIAACFVGAVITLIFTVRKVHFQRSASPLTPGQWLLSFVCNPAVWMLLLVIFLLFLG